MSTKSTASNRTFRRRIIASSAVCSAVVAAIVVASAGGAQAAVSVGLGTADGFAVLAGAGITNTGATTITGDIGTFPTTTVTDAGALTISGVNHGGDAVTQNAKNDLTTAYNNAAGQASDAAIVADLAGSTLVSGVYTAATTMGLTGTVTLDGAGNADAVFIFQAGTSLTTGAGSRVQLTNGAQACNVFWQLGSSATLGTGTAFVGTIMASTSITLTTGATLQGRALAGSGAVTLDSNVITRATCATSGVAAYAANVGPGAQGLVCPWGGQFDGVGLCLGTGTTSLSNPVSVAATSSSTPTPTPGASGTTGAPATPRPSATRPARPTTPASRPPSGGASPSTPASTPPQVTSTPSGGVDSGS